MLDEEVFMRRKDAASYLKMPSTTLDNQLRSGGGPAYVRISPHTVLFRKCDLDAWRATWTEVKPK